MPEAPLPEKPAPAPQTALDEQFWAHCGEGRLCFQRCSGCATWRHLPRSLCAACGSREWQWCESSGRGRIYSWSVTHQAMDPSFATDVPYAVVLVELEEGVRMVSGVRGIEIGDLALDLPVEVCFESRASGPSLPLFRPRSPGQ